MKILLWLIFWLEALSSDSSTKVWNAKTFVSKQDTLYCQGKLFTGTLARAYPKTEETYVLGLKHGTITKWFANGQLAERRYYQYNEKEGRHEAWWSNGQKKFDYTFEDGVSVGVHKEWYENGRLFSVSTYNALGQPEGLQQMWFVNGKIKANYEVKAGRRFGLLGAKGCMGENEKQTIKGL